MMFCSNKIKLLLLLVMPISVNISYSQTISIVEKAPLPVMLIQSSGIEVVNKNYIWSHNDSSGNPELYSFDSTGILLRTLKILNATNIDWEDMAQDALGNFYIGDFGNNTHNRQDLKIYIIPDPATILVDSVIPQVINYSYSDQFAFPPPDSLKNFDAEAMIAYQDSLYIFSKDWSNPYSGYTKLYKLPSAPGTYVAELIDSFYTGPGPTIPYSITSADISPDNTRLILLGYNKCWLFTNFTGNDFFSGTSQLFNIPLSQKEAIGFITNDDLYVTDELVSTIGRKLYYMKIHPDPSALNELENEPLNFTVFPNPFSEKITISIATKEAGNYTLTIYNELGQKIFLKKGFSSPGTAHDLTIDESVFKNNSGIFIIEVSLDNGQVFRKEIVKY
ncbi:MAG: T9SS type A sorting domain-containing protein [Bacteroidota bacterium]